MKIVLLACLISWASIAYADLSSVSRKEREALAFLLEVLITDHDFGYTIYGSKPMALGDICLTMPADLSFEHKLHYLYFRYKIKRALKAWKKHKALFCSETFLILDTPENPSDCLTFIVIHRNHLLDILERNWAHFQKELGKTFTPLELLQQLESGTHTLCEAIKANDKLLGIMLGYGVRNASLFQERAELKRALAEQRKFEGSVDTLMHKLNLLEMHLTDFNALDEEARIHPLYFLADPMHPETHSLNKQYENERQEILRLIEKGDFLESTLERLAG